MTETCNNCRFHHAVVDNDQTVHFCRFDPPEFSPPNSSVGKPVMADWWCGKWQLWSTPMSLFSRTIFLFLTLVGIVVVAINSGFVRWAFEHW